MGTEAVGWQGISRVLKEYLGLTATEKSTEASQKPVIEAIDGGVIGVQDAEGVC